MGRVLGAAVGTLMPSRPLHAAVPGRDATRPVVLVHGILGQRHAYWNLFRSRLERDGFEVHEATLPYLLLGDIGNSAVYLRDRVEGVLSESGARRVDLVCHSGGGLVARHYLRFLGGEDRVAHLVCMATPHQGTWLSYALPLPVPGIARQTRPGSDYLRELGRRAHGHVPVTNLWSRLDGVVIPSTNARLPGARNVELGWTGHWAFLWRRDVYDIVRKALEEGGVQQRLDDGGRAGGRRKARGKGARGPA